MPEPLASAVVRIAADDAPLKSNLGRLAGLLHEIGDAIDRYVNESGEGDVTEVPWPLRVWPVEPTPLHIGEDK